MIASRTHFILNETFSKGSMYSENGDFCFQEAHFNHMKDDQKLKIMAKICGLCNSDGGVLFNGLKKQDRETIRVSGIILKDSGAQDTYLKSINADLKELFKGLNCESAFKVDFVPVLGKQSDTTAFEGRYVIRIKVAHSPSNLVIFNFHCDCFDGKYTPVYSFQWAKGKVIPLSSKDMSKMPQIAKIAQESKKESQIKPQKPNAPAKHDSPVISRSDSKPSNSHFLECVQSRQKEPSVLESPGDLKGSKKPSNQYIDSLPKGSGMYREKSNSVFIPAQPVLKTLEEARGKQAKIDQERKNSDFSCSTLSFSDEKPFNGIPVARSAEKIKMIPSETVSIKEIAKKFESGSAQKVGSVTSLEDDQKMKVTSMKARLAAFQKA